MAEAQCRSGPWNSTEGNIHNLGVPPHLQVDTPFVRWPDAWWAALHAEHVHSSLSSAEEAAEAEEGADGHGGGSSPILGHTRGLHAIRGQDTSWRCLPPTASPTHRAATFPGPCVAHTHQASPCRGPEVKQFSSVQGCQDPGPN